MAKEPKNYEDLTFVDDFMFAKILSTNLGLCKELVELILGREISRIQLAEPQKTVKLTRESKGIRFDVYTTDGSGTSYDLEMQTTTKKNLAKRTRYYHAVDTLNQVKEGEDYEVLKPSYVVFICSDGLKGNRELPVYTYCMRSREDLKDELGDGSYTVFVNAKGNAPGMSREFREFLDYLKTGQVPDGECFVRRLHQELLRAREHPDWRREYMTLEMKINDARAESRAEGMAIMSQLYSSLKKENRLDDYERAIADNGFRDALLKEFGLYPS